VKDSLLFINEQPQKCS